MSRAVLLIGDRTSANIYHYSGFVAPDPFVFISDKRGSLVIVTELEAERAHSEARVDQVLTLESLGYDKVWATLGSAKRAMARIAAMVLADHGVATVVVEPDLALIYAEELRAAAVSLAVDESFFVTRRRLKRPDEVDAIAACQLAAEQVMRKVIDIIRQSEVADGYLWHGSIALTSEYLQRVTATEFLNMGYDHNGPIVACGPQGAQPHNHGAGQLRSGSPVVLDFFPRSAETLYHGDITRTVWHGTCPSEVEHMFDTVLEAQQEALRTLGPGVNGRDVHRKVCSVFQRAGYGSSTRNFGRGVRKARFIHGTGHGIGLEVHEQPRINDTDVILSPGDVVTVEPGLYDLDWGGVRIEDLVVITENGVRNLTSLQKTF